MILAVRKNISRTATETPHTNDKAPHSASEHISGMDGQTQMPWRYWLGRQLLDATMGIFYRSVVVENAEFIPSKDEACLLLSNHDNCFVDFFLLDWAPPSESRKFLRTVTKSTAFKQKDYAGVFVRQTGCIPIYRRMDFDGQAVDNTDAFRGLADALTRKDTVLMFPEGNTQYRPYLRPFKTGAARAISEALTLNRDDPDFQITVLTCSINYTRRYSFRSSVLITYHAPVVYRVKDHPELIAPVDFDAIRHLTDEIGAKISSGTISAASWDIHRAAKLATKIYAPFGRRMGLGDRMRIRKRFADAFSSPPDDSAQAIALMCPGLQDYDNELSTLGIRDEYARQPMPSSMLLVRMLACLASSLCLFLVALPSLPLWLPVLLAPIPVVRGLLRTTTEAESHVRIAQARFIIGSFARLLVHLACVLSAAYFNPYTGTSALIFTAAVAAAVPALMWLGLRATEDGLHALAEAHARARTLWHGTARMAALRAARARVCCAVRELAVGALGLPADPQAAFVARVRDGPDPSRLAEKRSPDGVDARSPLLPKWGAKNVAALGLGAAVS